MLDSEKKSLYERQSKYMNIGITERGEVARSIPVPWKSTAHAYNMRIPDIYIAPEDLKDKELMEKISSFHVLGCYILTPIEDYNFIAGFGEIRDIYIIKAAGLRDLSFLEKLGEWQMLFIEGAQLDDLRPVLTSSKIKRTFPAFCLGFSRCKVNDISALYEMNNISELAVFGESDAEEQAKWKQVNAHQLMLDIPF